MSEVDFSNVYKYLIENTRKLKTKEEIRMSNKNNNSSYTSIDKIALAQACEAVIKNILTKRKEKKETIIQRRMESVSYFFGLFKTKPKTRAEAIESILNDGEPFGIRMEYGLVDSYCSEQISTACNLLELCKHSASDKINVSSEDFSCVSYEMPDRKVSSYR